MVTEFYEILQQAYRIGPRHYSGIAILKVAALPWMIHTQTSHQHCQSMRLLPCQRMHENQHLTISDTATGLNISLTVCQMVLTF
jgi:hypothetical protein